MGYTSVHNLKDHVNFKVPDKPTHMDIKNIVRFTLAYAANLVSPEKEQDEDESRPCTDVAKEIRESEKDILNILDNSEMYWDAQGPE